MGALLLCSANIDIPGLKWSILIFLVNEGVGFVRSLVTGERAAN